jgi:hypothetical protein
MARCDQASHLSISYLADLSKLVCDEEASSTITNHHGHSSTTITVSVLITTKRSKLDYNDDGLSYSEHVRVLLVWKLYFVGKCGF